MKRLVLAHNIAHPSIMWRALVRENGVIMPRNTPGRLAQLVQSAWFTPRRSQVRILYRPLEKVGSKRLSGLWAREAVWAPRRGCGRSR